jgi:hypothetical protein
VEPWAGALLGSATARAPAGDAPSTLATARAAQPAASSPDETSFGAMRSANAAIAGLHTKAPASDAGLNVERSPRGIEEKTMPSQKADLITNPIKASRLACRDEEATLSAATLCRSLEDGVVKLPIMRANEFTLH